jgi:hypothetical protein
MTTTRRIQIGLILFGIALLAVGGVVLLQEVSPKRYVGILTWFVGALIIHDGIIAPAVFGTTLIMRKAAGRISPVVIAIVQGTLVIGGIVLLIVVPEILKKQIGTLSSSILPQNYLLNLVAFIVVLGGIAILAIVGYLRMYASRQKVLPSSDQD